MSTANSTGRHLKPVIALAAALAVLGYAVAWVQSEKGAGLYDEYVEAYKTCLYSVPGRTEDDGACRSDPEAVRLLAAHREAVAFGEPFFNVALVITAGLLLAGCGSLIRRRRQKSQAPDSEGTAAKTP